MNITLNNIDQLAWQKMDALIPAIVQHAKTGEVLMQGYMNQAAITQTLTNQKVTFYSRSKQRLWQKGESSGNVLELVTLSTDCDQDSLLVQALPQGPTCHLGTASCFAEQQTPELSFISQLEQVVAERKNADANSSYTASLYADGIRKIAQKVGEEGVEVALAAVAQEDDELLGESADLLFHLLVLLQARNLSLGQVVEVLKQRHNLAKSVK